jgi:signal transduction histidine kinase
MESRKSSGGHRKEVARIKEWITPIVVGAYADETVLTVAKRMQQYGIGSVIVNTLEKKPVGILTERDVLNKVVAPGLDPKTILVKEIMTSPIETVNVSCSPFEVFRLFAEREFRHLPVTLDDGRIIGVLSFRSKGFIQEVCRIMSVLESVNELKSRFLANVSHELRTPLVSITKSAALLMDHTSEVNKEDALRFLKIIENQGTRLLQLIGDLLDMTALEAGKMRIERRNVDLVRLIETSMRNNELMARHKNITMSFERLTDNTTIFADESRIIQVLDNLISNAIKFTPEAGTIAISAQREESGEKSVRVAVRDTGIGIPQEKMRMIFERFEQAHDPALGKPEGTGLGLSIVKEIVSLHNGSVWVESEEKKGSTFYVTLPAAEAIYS